MPPKRRKPAATPAAPKRRGLRSQSDNPNTSPLATELPTTSRRSRSRRTTPAAEEHPAPSTPTKQASPLPQVVELSDTEERIETPSPKSERSFIDLTSTPEYGTDQEDIEPFTPTKPTLEGTQATELPDTDEKDSIPQHNIGDFEQAQFRQAQLEYAVKKAGMDLANIYEVSPAALEGAHIANLEQVKIEREKAVMASYKSTRRRKTIDTDDEDIDNTAEIEAEMKKRDAKRKWNLQKRAREKFVHGNEPFQTSSEQIAEDEERRARIAEQEREAKRKEREAKEQERKRMAECITGSEEALATLKKIEEDKMLLAKERRQAEEDKKRQEKERKHFWDDIDGEDEEMEDGEEQSEDEDDSMAVNTNAHVAPNNPPPAVVAEPNAEQQQAQKPAVPAVPATPPQTRRWGLGSVLNTVKQFIPRLATPYLTQEPPATAPPATHDPATETMDISESPSHARAQRQPSKLRRKKSRKDNRSRLPPLKTKFQADKAYARTLLKRVPDEQRPAVQSWYDDIRAKAEENCRVRTGDKRKRIEEAPKIDELASIPSHPPWQSNGYGLTEGFFDYSDSESDDQGGAKGRGVVPEYYQKYLQAEHPDSPPAKKKYKTAHTDSFGRSTSRTDLHPRPSFMPSPMFENFGHQYQGGNVFQQDDVAKPKDSNDKQLKRTGHIPGTGTFCVPECDSDDEGSTVLDGEASNEAKTSTSAESVKGKAGSPTNYKAPTVEDAPASSSDASSDVSSDGSSNFKPWTQQPPPAPTPAHASLPGMTPADGSTSSPQKVSPQLSATVPAAKPATGSEAESVKRQRERLEKYKPAIPSGLRESSRLSTSTVNSDGSGDAETISSNTGPSLGSGLLTQAYDAKSPPKIAPSAEKKNGSQTSREIVPPEPVPDRYGGILFDVDRGHLTGNGRFWNIEYPSAPEKAYTSMFIGPLPEPDLLDGDEEVLQAVSQAVMKNPLFAEQSVEYFYGKDSGFDQFEKGLFEDDEDMTDLDLADDTSESEEDGVFPQSDPRAKTIKEMDRLMAGANKK